MIKPNDIFEYCFENFDGITLVRSWGEDSLFYNPDNRLKRGVYILTIKEKDGLNDSASNLNRENIYRVNIGIRKNSFLSLFGEIPKRAAKGQVVEMDFEFDALNQIIPHPVYAWMSWICALNPDEKTFENLKPYIYEAYEYAKEKFEKRVKEETK